jgi:hypothetical protein
MKVYSYNTNTGEFLGSQDALESPLEHGVFLIPAGATEVQPPTPSIGSVAVFGDGEWTVLPDHRGETYWLADGSEHVVDFIGDLPENALSEKPVIPPAPPTWDEVRAQRNALLSASDWTQLPDVELSTEQVMEWRSYRQQLRDITDIFAAPESVIWPVILN